MKTVLNRFQFLNISHRVWIFILNFVTIIIITTIIYMYYIYYYYYLYIYHIYNIYYFILLLFICTLTSVNLEGMKFHLR